MNLILSPGVISLGSHDKSTWYSSLSVKVLSGNCISFPLLRIKSIESGNTADELSTSIFFNWFLICLIWSGNKTKWTIRLSSSE